MGKIRIIGTIKRNCERCGELRDCNSFESKGKSHIMCQECTYEKFQRGDIIQDQDRDELFEPCCSCKLNTMRQDMDKTEITETHVIKYFECLKCGNKQTQKIKKWRKK